MLSKRLSDGGEGPLSPEALEDVLERTEQARRSMFRHTFPPTALGLRQTTLSHKVHAFLHSLRLEHKTWLQLQGFLSSTFAYTSDMGTEGSFNLTQVDVPEYFPYWPDQTSNSTLSLQFDEDGGALEDDGAGVGELPDGAAEQPQQQQERAGDTVRVDLSSALYVPGMFHIIDNATKDVLKKSEVREATVKTMLESVLLFFNAFHRRKWFVAKCCVGRFEGYSVFFQSASPKLEGGRAWGVVSAGVAWVLERKLMLQQAWNSDSLVAAANAEHADQSAQEGSKLVARVDEALQSPVFWAFLSMCSSITDILDAITSSGRS